tara:strand:- start:532 stop:744 length:213 start_codon:yes stop_codon:yes gene_type:complete
MNNSILDNICNKLSENKEIKQYILNIKKYIDSSFIFLYIVCILIIIVLIITITLLLIIIYFLNKNDFFVN